MGLVHRLCLCGMVLAVAAQQSFGYGGRSSGTGMFGGRFGAPNYQLGGTPSSFTQYTPFTPFQPQQPQPQAQQEPAAQIAVPAEPTQQQLQDDALMAILKLLEGPQAYGYGVLSGSAGDVNPALLVAPPESVKPDIVCKMTRGKGNRKGKGRRIRPKPILEVGVADDPNPRYRPTMEDAQISVIGLGAAALVNNTLNPSNKKNTGYFGVYDGHGGRETVDYVLQRLHQNVEQALLTMPPPRALEAAFLGTDDEMSTHHKFLQSGTTAAVALVLPSKVKKHSRDMYLANAGDARVVIAEENNCGQLIANRLTYDHRPDHAAEIERIQAAGGFIFAKRVNAVLAISRALGDHGLKSAGVTGQPSLNKITLRPRQKFMIVACDGLFDVLSDQDALNAVAGMTDPTKMAQKLVDLALAEGTTDNVSVMIVKLQDY